MRAPRQRVDQGATATEYALVAGLIALIVVASVTTLGVGVRGLFDVVVVNWP